MNPGPCTPPNNIGVRLVYPAPNSTGIPDSISGVILGSTATIPAGYDLYLVNNNTEVAFFFNQFTAAPSPLPTPNAPPSFANPVYQISATPSGAAAFTATSTISVYFNQLNSQTCTPTYYLGSFTVQ